VCHAPAALVNVRGQDGEHLVKSKHVTGQNPDGCLPASRYRPGFALAYGGNGITDSMLGAGLLRAQIDRRPHPLTVLFSFARLGSHWPGSSDFTRLNRPVAVRSSSGPCLA
jgi:hypothetical protein